MPLTDWLLVELALLLIGLTHRIHILLDEEEGNPISLVFQNIDLGGHVITKPRKYIVITRFRNYA